MISVFEVWVVASESEPRGSCAPVTVVARGERRPQAQPHGKSNTRALTVYSNPNRPTSVYYTGAVQKITASPCVSCSQATQYRLRLRASTVANQPRDTTLLIEAMY
jgi:hypothetical protein